MVSAVTMPALAYDIALSPTLLHQPVTHLQEHFGRLHSTYFGQPTAFEKAIAHYLIQALVRANPDYSEVRRCQFVSRFPEIRAYQATHPVLGRLLDADE